MTTRAGPACFPSKSGSICDSNGSVIPSGADDSMADKEKVGNSMIDINCHCCCSQKRKRKSPSSTDVVQKPVLGNHNTSSPRKRCKPLAEDENAAIENNALVLGEHNIVVHTDATLSDTSAGNEPSRQVKEGINEMSLNVPNPSAWRECISLTGKGQTPVWGSTTFGSHMDSVRVEPATSIPLTLKPPSTDVFHQIPGQQKPSKAAIVTPLSSFLENSSSEDNTTDSDEEEVNSETEDSCLSRSRSTRSVSPVMFTPYIGDDVIQGALQIFKKQFSYSWLPLQRRWWYLIGIFSIIFAFVGCSQNIIATESFHSFVAGTDVTGRKIDLNIAAKHEHNKSPMNTANRRTQDKKGICIRGGGFPGFFFTLGQLQSLNQKISSLDGHLSSYNFYCYSAGCLCLVAFFADLSLDQVMGIAAENQNLWKKGEISRFDVVPRFVEQMVQQIVIVEKRKSALLTDTMDSNSTFPYSSRETTATKSELSVTRGPYWWLDNLQIITGRRSTWSEGLGGLAVSIRSVAHTLNESNSNSTRNPAYRNSLEWTETLRKMLIQTTWIPGVTGNDLFFEDHIDGGFIYGKAPQYCDRTIQAPTLNWPLLSNIFNSNLSQEQASYFWKAGLEYEKENL